MCVYVFMSLSHFWSHRNYQCQCGGRRALPLAASTPCDMPLDNRHMWDVMKALVAAGHVLSKSANQIARIHLSPDSPLSAVRWLVQQGMTFDSELLAWSARAGRVDMLQLAHNMRVPITAEVITAAAAESNWEVLVWASRNGVPIDCARLQQLLRQKRSKFKFPEQKAELLALLRDVRKRTLAHTEEKVDGAGDAKRPQKRRKAKR